MSKARWTYEQPPGGEGDVGLEEYVVYTTDGKPAGKVTAVLRRDDQLYLVVDRGSPPLSHDRRAVPWQEVADVDHGALGVILRLSPTELDRVEELDPARGVEPPAGGGSTGAAAVRVTDLPADVAPGASVPGEPGPADRPVLYAAALGLGLVAVLSFLAVVALLSAGGDWLAFFFLVPVLLGAASLFLGYRLWRRPYEEPPEGRSGSARR